MSVIPETIVPEIRPKVSTIARTGTPGPDGRGRSDPQGHQVRLAAQSEGAQLVGSPRLQPAAPDRHQGGARVVAPGGRHGVVGTPLASRADRNFKRWFHWARCSRLEPVRRVAEMLKRHWANIRTFFEHRITNAGAESINEKIQTVKRRARGFRNRERFRNAIFFHCGGLDLYPATLRAGS